MFSWSVRRRPVYDNSRKIRRVVEELIFQTEVVTHNLIKLIRAIRGDNGYSGWRYLIHLHVKSQPVEKFDYGGSRKVAFVVKEVINAIQVKSGTKFQVFK